MSTFTTDTRSRVEQLNAEPSDSSQPTSLSSLSAPSLCSSIGTPHSTPTSGCSVEYVTLLDSHKDFKLKPWMLQSSGSFSSSDAKITAETERVLAAPPQSSTISGKIIWLKANSQNDGSKKDNLGVINYILKRTHTISLVWFLLFVI